MTNETTEILPVPLTEEDKLELGGKIAELEIQIEEIETKKKSAVDAFNVSIKEKSAECLALSHKLKSGVKEEGVDCYWSLDDPRPGQKTLFRYDTGEKVRITSMAINDSQMELPLDEDDDNEDQDLENIEEAQIIDESHQLPSGQLALPENRTEEEAA